MDHLGQSIGRLHNVFGTRVPPRYLMYYQQHEHAASLAIELRTSKEPPLVSCERSHVLPLMPHLYLTENRGGVSSSLR